MLATATAKSLFCVAILLFSVSGISCRGLDATIKLNKLEKQLFVSRRIVGDEGEFDGGVLVDENGVIENLLTRSEVEELSYNGNGPKVIDGGNIPLLPGGVDSHVHVNEPGRTSWEGYETATKAAAWGGITTIIDMPLNSIPPTTTIENLKIKTSAAKEEVYIDVGFWGGVIPGNAEELLKMINAGVIGFKSFLIDSGVSEFPKVDHVDIEKALNVLNGTQAVYAFHAELPFADNITNTECNECGCQDPEKYSTYLSTKPEIMELDAVTLLASYIPKYDVHVHVVHVSSEGVVPILEEAREQRIAAGNERWRGGVTAETCHHYLTLSSEQVPPGNTEFKCSPPIRNNANKQKLWQYIQEKRLDLIASDHSPSVATLKEPNFFNAWGGISSVQFGLSLFWTEAKARGFNLETLIYYLSAGPARLAGLEKRKGAIRVGLDADLIFFDPDASFIVTPETIQYKNKLSPYMNRVLTGKVIQTYVRGRLIFSNGQFIGGPQGELLINGFK